MKRTKKILMCFLTFVMIVSSICIAGTQHSMASGTYVIKVDGTDNYLYQKDGKAAVGELDESNKAFYWFVINKGNDNYWIQNRGTGQYMCLENQKGTSGSVDVISNNYDNWESGKWILDLNSSTTIRNKWKGNNGYISVSGEEAKFGENAQNFLFIAKLPSVSEKDEYEYTGGAADWIIIPDADSDINKIGAVMPYTRYDSEEALLGNGAVLETAGNFDKDNLASQASEQSYVRLPGAGAYAEWKVNTSGNGVTMRFTMPDSQDGMGLDGSLDVYVNDEKVKTVDITSYYMWQYFSDKALCDEPRDGAQACFAFDEIHFKLESSLKAGDRIRIQSTGENGLEYGVDFLEIEETGAAIAKPENAYDVTDFGAVPNDGRSDAAAINACISKAVSDGRDVYIPEGTFEFDRIWTVNASNIKITGAGIWYTNIQFTKSGRGQGGISGNAYNVEFSDMYINSNLRSRYNENAVYKCFMETWSGGSYIHDIWEDHFECGFWIADYAKPISYSDGLKIINCRIRNNFADGVNFSQGTGHAAVYNCNIRNNGDDGLAIYNSSYLDVKDETGNVFCYNTIELIWRAGAIAVYGGNDHKIYNNYIADTFMSSGIHLNTVFAGYKFLNNDDKIVFTNNIIVRSGTYSDAYNSDIAAVDIMDGVRNVVFENTYIYDAQHDAVRIIGNPFDIEFINLNVYGTGLDGKITSRSNPGSLFNFGSKSSTQLIAVNGLNYADVANPDIIFGSRSGCTITDENNMGSDYTFIIPAGATDTVGVVVPERYRQLPPDSETETSAEETTEVTAEETTEIRAEETTEVTAEETTEIRVEETTEVTAEETTEALTEETAEQETEITSEALTEAVSESGTESGTDIDTSAAAPSQPATGDGTAAAAYMLICLLSAAVLAVTAAARRKTEN